MSSLSSLTLLNGKKARYVGSDTIIMPIGTNIADLPAKDAKFGLIFIFNHTLTSEQSLTLKEIYKGNGNSNIIPLTTILDITYFEALFNNGSGGGTGTLTQNQEKQWGFQVGNTTTGDILGTEEILIVPTTITNAVLVINSGTFPATTTTLKIKSSTVDYITVSVPANQGAGVITCTITTALINATPTTPITAILNVSQACPAVDFAIYTTTNS